MIGITNIVNKKASEVEKINLTLKTNQSSHTVLNGVNFTLSYGNYTKSYTWNGSTITIEVPAYVIYTITFGGVANYTTPASITYTALSGNARTVTVEYIQILKLTVKVSGLSNGFKLTVKYGSITEYQTTTSATYNMNYGDSWSVTASSVSGYTYSGTSSGTMVANKTVTITYNRLNGVFVATSSGELISPDSYDSSLYTAVGIAIINDNVSFIMDKARKNTNWYRSYVDISSLTNYTSASEAMTDYNGVSNTDIIISRLGSDTSNAAGYVRSKTITYGDTTKIGYLGSAGEWQAIIDNYSEVEDALSKIGGFSLSSYAHGDYYWTSTEMKGEYAWTAFFATESYNYELSLEYHYKDNSSYYYSVPFYEL